MPRREPGKNAWRTGSPGERGCNEITCNATKRRRAGPIRSKAGGGASAGRPRDGEPLAAKRCRLLRQGPGTARGSRSSRPRGARRPGAVFPSRLVHGDGRPLELEIAVGELTIERTFHRDLGPPGQRTQELVAGAVRVEDVTARLALKLGNVGV